MIAYKRNFFFIHLFLFLFGASTGIYAESLDKVAKKISSGAKSLQNKKVAVLPFPYHDGRESPGSTIVSERLITKLVEQKKLDVIERSLLEKVLKELKLQASGAIDEESAKQLGKILGVEAIVSGTLIDLGETEVEVNARLIKTETGQIIVACSGPVERFWKDEIPEKKEAEETTKSKHLNQERTLLVVERPMNVPMHENSSPAMAMGNRGEQPMRNGSPFQQEPPMGQSPMDMGQTPVMHEGPEGGFPPSSMGVPSEGPMGEPENRVWAGPIDSFLRESGFQSELVYSPVGQQMMMGMRLLKKEDWQGAERHFSNLSQHLNDMPDIEALAKLGHSISVFESGETERGVREAREIAKQNDWPRISAVAHFVLGRFNEKMGRIPAAKEHYLEVVRLQPFQTILVRRASHRLRVLGGGHFNRGGRPMRQDFQTMHKEDY